MEKQAAMEKQAKHRCEVGTADLLLAYGAGRLDADAAIRLDRHVSGCGECQEFLAGQRLAWDALEAYGRATPRVTANFDEQLYARIAQEQTGSWWQRTWRRWFESGEPVNWKPAGALAFACLAVAVGLSLRTGLPVRTGGFESKPKPAPVVLAFDKQEIEQIDRALEDFEMLNKMGTPAEEMEP